MKKVAILNITTFCFMLLASPDAWAQNTTQNVPIQDTPVVSVQAPAGTVALSAGDSSESSPDRTNVIGLSGTGFYEINTDFESLYVQFPTNNINAAGFGFGGFFEKKFSDKLGGELGLGYSRLIYSSKFRNTVKENFFTADVLGHYYFGTGDTVVPYLSFGAGAYASSNAVAPTVDAGFGSHFMLSKEFSIKADVLVKSAIIFNRGEARLGVAYHF